MSEGPWTPQSTVVTVETELPGQHARLKPSDSLKNPPKPPPGILKSSLKRMCGAQSNVESDNRVGKVSLHVEAGVVAEKTDEGQASSEKTATATATDSFEEKGGNKSGSPDERDVAIKKSKVGVKIHLLTYLTFIFSPS